MPSAPISLKLDFLTTWEVTTFLGFPSSCLIIVNKNLTFYSVNLTFYSVVKVCNNNVRYILLLICILTHEFSCTVCIIDLETVGVWDAPKSLWYFRDSMSCWLFWTKNLTFYSKMISFRRIVDFHRKYLKYVDTYHVWMLQTANEVPISTFTTLKMITITVRNRKT